MYQRGWGCLVISSLADMCAISCNYPAGLPATYLVRGHVLGRFGPLRSARCINSARAARQPRGVATEHCRGW